MFGKTRIENDEKKAVGTLLSNGKINPKAHPWAVQLAEDLEIVKTIPEAADFTDIWNGSMAQLMYDTKAVDAFKNFPVEVVRQRCMAGALPEATMEIIAKYLPRCIKETDEVDDGKLYECGIVNGKN